MQMLPWRHRLRESEEDFRSGSWERSSRLGAALHGALHGSTTGIIGYGAIERALATLWSGGFGLDALPHMLAQCDFASFA